MSQELLNHKEKCRLCFQPVGVSRIFSIITESVQQTFFSLTNIELMASDKFSDYICHPCLKSLNESTEFQHKIIDNQQRLYAFEETHSRIVKAEPIQSDVIQFEEISIEDYLPKTEVFVDSWTEDHQTAWAPESSDVSSSPDDCNTAQDDDWNVALIPSKQIVPDETATQAILLRKKSNRKYSLEQLANAVEAVSSNRLNVSAAAKCFHVPKSTLQAVVKRNLLKDDEALQVKLENEDIRTHSSHQTKTASKQTKSIGQRYSKEDFEAALKAVVEGGLSVRGAAARYKVPRTTLRTHFRRESEAVVKKEFNLPTDDEELQEQFHSESGIPIRIPSDQNIEAYTLPELSINAEYSCDLCGFSIGDKRNLRTHLSLHAKKASKKTKSIRQKYAKEDFEAALKAVVEGLFTVRGAAKLYKVPRTTLQTRYRKESEAVVKKEFNLPTDDEELQAHLHSESGIPSSDQNIATYALRKLSINTEYSCDLCGFSIGDKRNLITHLSLHAKKASKQTKSIGQRYAKEDFERALEAVVEGLFTVRGAAKHYNVPRTTLQTRYKKESGPGDANISKQIFKCSFCEKVFQSNDTRRKHVVRDHLAPIGEFPCQVCGKIFKTDRKRHKHNDYAHERRTIRCKECGEVFEQLSRFRIHQLKHKQEVACHICGKLVKEGSRMTKHMNLHHATHEKYKCTFAGCSKAFQVNDRLSYHIKNVHGPERNVKCLECNSTFTNEYRMKKHLYRMHRRPKNQRRKLIKNNQTLSMA